MSGAWKVHRSNGMMNGKRYTYCLRSGLEVTDDNAKVTCFTCAKLIEEGRRMMECDRSTGRAL